MVFGTENTLAVGARGKGSGDRYWLLVGKNGIGSGGEGFAEAKCRKRTGKPQASSDGPVFLVPLLKLLI